MKRRTLKTEIFFCAHPLPTSRFSSTNFVIPAAIYRSAQGPRPESAPRSACRVILGTCLGVAQGCFSSVFLAFFSPERRKSQKTLEKHSLGHSEAGAQNHSKSTPWSTFRPGPLSSPVNGGQDRNTNGRSSASAYCDFVFIEFCSCGHLWFSLLQVHVHIDEEDRSRARPNSIHGRSSEVKYRSTNYCHSPALYSMSLICWIWGA